MLQLAAAKQAPGPAAVAFVTGDMMALPFPDARSISSPPATASATCRRSTTAIAEIHRVLRPGGLFLSLDFDRPRNALGARRLSRLSDRGRLRARLGAAPRPRHLSLHPGIDPALSRGRAVCGVVREQGFASCDYLPVLGGLMAIHRAVRER